MINPPTPLFCSPSAPPSSLRQQQEGQVSEGDEPEVRHALPGVQPARGQPGRGRQDPDRGGAGSQPGQEQVQE